MKKSLLTLFLLSGAFQINAQQISDHVPGQAMIMLKPGASLEKVTTKEFKLVQELSRRMKIYLLEFDASLNEDLVLDKLRSNPAVQLAQFNHFVEERATTPNDTYFTDMWGLHNTGQGGGTADADIDAPEAWDITTGGVTAAGDTIVVAVIDGGFQLSHIDVNFWKNYNEIPANGIDDDGNGYIDDVNGWNAYNNNGVITGGSSHGTHVAGTVAAKGNNNSGTTGISWNVKVMAVQGSSGTESTVVSAYNYVLETRKLYDSTNGAKGAFVVATNSSFGVNQGQPTNFPLWCAMYDSMGTAGILSATATANQNWNIDAVGDIPTACASPYMIAVTNTTNNDVKYGSAGYGMNTIDLGAPGTSIYSTVPTNNWSQSSWTGTSMATPHVAGTIGLMYAAACPEFIQDYKADPGGKALLMRSYLLNGVDTLSSLANLCATGGRLNAFNALVNVQGYSSCSLSSAGGGSTIAEMKKVYPNPASEFTEIEYFSSEANFCVTVKDIFGKTVKTIHRSNHAGMNQHRISLTELPAGVYMIGIGSGGKFMKVIKL